MSIVCGPDKSCPFLYECIDSKCAHDGIFPLSAYTGIVYFLLPFCVMLCNVVGISAGLFKVPILMDLLNYPVNQATILSYPIITGTALGNYIMLIPKRHPTRDTSLVDYHIVLILIPCVCFGTTLGVITVGVVPQLYQDIFLFTAFVLFSTYFGLRYRKTKEEVKQSEATEKMVELDETAKEQGDNLRLQQVQDGKSTPLTPQIKKDSQSENQSDGESQTSKRGEENNEIILELSKKLLYQSSFHVKDILISVVVFAVFETLALLAQGKIIRFSFCSWRFAVLFTSLCIVFCTYLFAIYKITCKKMAYYERIGYNYGVALGQSKSICMIAASGIVGGFLQGLIGLGAGQCIVGTLLYLGLNSRVASATSGYMIVFIGTSSLIEALANNEITWIQAAWYMSICFFLGGICTFVLYRVLAGSTQSGKITIAIIISLSILSSVSILPSIYFTQKNFGWDYMLDIPKPFCSE